MKKTVPFLLICYMLIAFTGCSLFTAGKINSKLTTSAPESLSVKETEDFSTPFPSLSTEPVADTDPVPSPSESASPATPILSTETTPQPAATVQPEPPQNDSEFVKVSDYIPDIVVELKYATTDNFTGQIIYDFQDAYLRYGTVKKLIAVSEDFARQNLRLKIWDAFRPHAAQFKLWSVYPDATFVANPNVTYSSHSRGNTVDITLVDAAGNELEMPTGFDDFSALADRDYSDCSAAAAKNALLLQNTMEAHGFLSYNKEWWHFSDETKYPPETQSFIPGFE